MDDIATIIATNMWQLTFNGSTWLVELIGEGRAVRRPVYGEQTKENANIVLRECRLVTAERIRAALKQNIK